MAIYLRVRELLRYSWSVKIPVESSQNLISLKSPNFYYGCSAIAEWCLILNTSTEGTKTYVSLHLQSIQNTFVMYTPIIKLTLAIIRPSWKKTRSSLIIFEIQQNKLYGFEKFTCLEKLGIYDFQIECILEEIKHYYENSKILQKQPSDLHLVFNGTKYSAHKFILATKSVYFRKIFTNSVNICEIEIKDMEFDMFYATMNYMYSGEICYTLHEDCEKIRRLFEVASKYKILGLVRKCCLIMGKNLSLENLVPNFFTCKQKFDSRYLRDYTGILKEFTYECMNFITNNFKSFIDEEIYKEFLDKEPRFLIDYLILLSIYLRRKFITRPSLELKVSCKGEFESFGKFINDETFSDIKIHVRDKTYFAHKVLLAGKSEVFQGMFSYNMVENIRGSVEIPNIEPPVFERLLRFIYTTEFDPNDDLIEDVLIAANYYKINDLKQNCEDTLSKRLTRENVTQMLIFADVYFANLLQERCVEFITNANSDCFKSDFISQFEENLMELINTHPHLFLNILDQVHSSTYIFFAQVRSSRLVIRRSN